MRPLLIAAGLTGLATAAAWLEMLMHAPSALGPICGHASAAVLHCPGCYAAAALALASAALLARAAAGDMMPIPARTRPPQRRG